MWDLPGPGLEPVFPALAGGVLITVPPGKPWGIFKYVSVLTSETLQKFPTLPPLTVNSIVIQL